MKRGKIVEARTVIPGGRIEEVHAIREYELSLFDPYWIRPRDELVQKGIPEFIATPALIRAEREISMIIAYR
jgi:hypothetical protein